MVQPSSLGHIRVVAGLIMLIGTFLFASMVLIAVGHPDAVVGVVLTTFLAGCAAGAFMIALGALLFFNPKLALLGSD